MNPVLGFWGKVVYRTGWVIVGLFAKTCFRQRVIGRDCVPPRGPALIASNHISHLDPPLVAWAARRYTFHMAKRELFRLPLLLALMRVIRTIVVDRGQGKQALVDAVEYLKHGACVIIFPEGTRSQSGRLSKGHSGTVVIAARSGSPIVPCAISGSEKALTKGSRRIRCVPVTVRFGEPYRLDYDGDLEHIPREFLQRETYRLMARIEQLLPEEMRPTAEQKRKWYGEVAG